MLLISAPALHSVLQQLGAPEGALEAVVGVAGVSSSQPTPATAAVLAGLRGDNITGLVRALAGASGPGAQQHAPVSSCAQPGSSQQAAAGSGAPPPAPVSAAPPSAPYDASAAVAAFGVPGP